MFGEEWPLMSLVLNRLTLAMAAEIVSQSLFGEVPPWIELMTK